MSKASEWAARIIHESEYHRDSIFATLTYADDSITDVNYETLKLFFKRLRYKTPGIKYYACGEYGEKTTRPHYHAIIFGLTPCNTCHSCRTRHDGLDNPTGDCLYIRNAWSENQEQIGHIQIDNVTYKSARYVANYLLKTPKNDTTNRTRPFTIMSNGIGKQWCLDHIHTLKVTKTIKIDGTERSLPKYYVDLIQKEYPEFDPTSDQKIERHKEIYDHYKEKYRTNRQINAAIRSHRAQTEENQYARDNLKGSKL